MTDKSAIFIGAGIAGLAGRFAVRPAEGGPHMNKTLRLLVLAAAVALSVTFLTGCGGGAARSTIEANDNLTFTPDTITVKPGQTVDLTLVNKGTLDHTFTIPDLDIEVIMRPGETNHITFTAPKAGEHRIICGVHFDKMQGKLIVE